MSLSPIKNIFQIIILLSFSSILYTQPSYQVSMDAPDIYLNDIVINNNDNILAFITENRPPISDTFFITPINEQQDQTGWKINYDPPFKLYEVKHSVFYENTVCFSHSQAGSSNSVVSCFNLETEQYWSKKLKYSISAEGGIFDINDAFEVTLADPSGSAFYKLDQNGSLIWKKGLIYKSIPPGLDIKLIPSNIKYHSNGEIYVIGRFTGIDTAEKSFIIRLDSQGNVLNAKIIEEYILGRLMISDNGIYVLNKGTLDYFWATDFWGFDKAVLVKLDFDLNIVWAKQYMADQFTYSTANIKNTAAGKLMMSHTTNGAFPAIFCEINQNGAIISQKGYPNYRPDMELLKDGSLVLGSRFTYDSSGKTSIQPSFSKTDTNGEIEGCSTYNTCLTSKDINIFLADFEIDTIDVLEPDNHGLIIEPITFSFSEGCNFPPIPTPDFLFPDTICIADSVRTTNTYNRLANAHEWYLFGPGIDSINTDSFDFGFRFRQAGEYLLKHTVWVLGCAYSFEKTIQVQPLLDISIVPDVLCPDQEELSLNSNRPLITYEWNTGSNSPILPINTTSIYWVQVSDGYCQASDTINAQLVTDLIGPSNPINLSSDTTICEKTLPFTLSVKSPYTDIFLIGDDSVFNESYLINESGSYSVHTEIYGCFFSNTFHLTTDPCQVNIYFPTVFSPNTDGVNDTFSPQGIGFEALALKVFDRWGGLLYDGKGNNVHWAPDNQVAQGMYVFQFYFKNLHTGEYLMETGEVILMR